MQLNSFNQFFKMKPLYYKTFYIVLRYTSEHSPILFPLKTGITMKKQTLINSANSVGVEVSVFIIKEGKQFTAYCPALELSSYGPSAEEAKANFDEAMVIFLEETERKGTLEKVLLKLGWSLQQKPKRSFQPPTLSQRLLKKYPGKVYKEKVSIPVS